MFETGVTIASGGNQASSGVNAFAPHFQAGSGEAIYFAAVIGQEVIPTVRLDEITPTPEPPPPTVAPIEPTEVVVIEEPTPTPVPDNPRELATDRDQDGLTMRDERRLGTDPNLWDTDGDGLSDGHEVQLGTNPLMVDTDGDGVSDYTEVVNETDPLDPDSN